MSSCLDGGDTSFSAGGDDAGYSPTGMHGVCSGASGDGGGDNKTGQQEQESSPWSAARELSGVACSGPRSRGKRDKWDIGDRYRVSANNKSVDACDLSLVPCLCFFFRTFTCGLDKIYLILRSIAQVLR